jgi:hypothetical protein
MRYALKTISILVAVLFIHSCADDDNPINDDDQIELSVIKTYEEGGITYEILSEETELIEGYNEFYIKAKDSDGNDLTADFDINIVMDMGQMMHSTPFEYEMMEDATNGGSILVIKATFIMPTVEMGVWMIDAVSESLGADHTIEFNVAPSGNVKRFTSNEKPYFVTLRTLKSPEVGMNDFNLTVHTRENMMSHPAVDSLTIEIEPRMPSMGHGSNGNENPLYTENGLYEGNVNFNMTGDWEITVTLLDGKNEIGSVVYTLDL